jgi:hypothetical protein
LTSTLCPLEHRSKKSRQPGVDVCEWHAKRTETALLDLPNVHDLLALQLNPTSSQRANIQASKNPGLNLDPRVIECRSDIRNVLSTWCRHGVDEGPFVTLPPDDVAWICGWLQQRLDWYLAQSFGHAFVLDVIGPWETGRRLLDPNPVRRFPVGPCPKCTGVLVAELRPADDLLPPFVVCDRSPLDDDGEPAHKWTADRWMHLGRTIREVQP